MKPDDLAPDAPGQLVNVESVRPDYSQSPFTAIRLVSREERIHVRAMPVIAPFRPEVRS